VAPLKAASDALTLDSTNLTIDEVFARVMQQVYETFVGLPR
jgi:cytidylate kinase